MKKTIAQNKAAAKKAAPAAPAAIKAVLESKVAEIAANLAALKASDTGLGPNEKFPFGIRITNPGGNISWERFKTAKERDSRLPQKGAEAVNYSAQEPKAAPAAPAAPKAAPAAPKAAPKASDTLAIHVNKTGRVCFGKDAAARLLGFFKPSDSKYCIVAVDKGIVRIEPVKKDSPLAVDVRDADAAGRRPYISATKQFKPLGFDGSRPYDIEAKPYGAAGFEFRLA